MTTPQPQPGPVPQQTSGAEAIGAGAVGGAALGSVVGMAAGIGTLFLPVLGTAAGALSGAALGWIVTRLAAKRREKI